MPHLILFYCLPNGRHHTVRACTLFGQRIGESQRPHRAQLCGHLNLLQVRGGLPCWHMKSIWEKSLLCQTHQRWVRKNASFGGLWDAAVSAECWKIHQCLLPYQRSQYQQSLLSNNLYELPMGNKVLKYCLTSRVRLCPCHNTPTKLNNFLWVLLGLLTTGWLLCPIAAAGMCLKSPRGLAVSTLLFVS